MRSRIVVATALSGLLLTSVCAAQEDRRAQADAAFQAGLSLHDRDREAEALEKFRAAYALYPSPNTLIAIARAEQLLGQRLAALRHFREALRHPMIASASSEIANKYVRELAPSFARVELHGPKGAVVALNGDEYILPVAQPLDLEPGAVHATATFGHDRYEGRAQADAGRSSVLELVPLPSAPPNDHVEPPPVDEPRPFWDTGRIVGASLVAVGAVSFVASGVFSSSSFSHREDADGLSSRLGPTACSGGSPAPQCSNLQDERDAVDRDGTLSAVLLVTGIATVATGAAFFLWPRSTSTRIVPTATAQSTGITVLGTF